MLGILSTVLKGMATVLHAVPVLGQLANSAIAAGFILVFGGLAERHYAKARPHHPSPSSHTAR